MTSKREGQSGRLFILSAPAGTGKNTLITRLCNEFPNLVESTSCTTRQPRRGESEGEHYHFVSEKTFLQKIAEGAFLEHVELFGSRYGTLRETIERDLAKSLCVILVIDTQGALQLKEKIDATTIFLAPPSLEELRLRLERRKSEDPKEIEERLKRAAEEIKLAGHYDYYVINDEMDEAYEVLRAIFIAEQHRNPKVKR